MLENRHLAGWRFSFFTIFMLKVSFPTWNVIVIGYMVLTSFTEDLRAQPPTVYYVVPFLEGFPSKTLPLVYGVVLSRIIAQTGRVCQRFQAV